MMPRRGGRWSNSHDRNPGLTNDISTTRASPSAQQETKTVDETNHSPADRGDERVCNFSGNVCFADIIARRYGRRDVLKGGVAVAVSTFVAGNVVAQAVEGGKPAVAQDAVHRAVAEPGFTPIPHNYGDDVVVPDGYGVRVLLPEGEAIIA